MVARHAVRPTSRPKPAPSLLDGPGDLINYVNRYGLEPRVGRDGRLVVCTAQFGRAVIEQPEDAEWLAVDLGLVAVESAGRPSKGGYLPASQVSDWMHRVPWHDLIPQRAGDLKAKALARALRRIATREQASVSVAWAEEFVDRIGLQLEDLWPDLDAALEEGQKLRFRNQARGRHSRRSALRPAPGQLELAA